jgi:hypothetical protein
MPTESSLVSCKRFPQVRHAHSPHGPRKLPRSKNVQAVSLREIVQALNKRRQELRTLLKNRQKAVDTLISLKRGRTPEEAHASSPVSGEPTAPKLKRSRNE